MNFCRSFGQGIGNKSDELLHGISWHGLSEVINVERIWWPKQASLKVSSFYFYWLLSFRAALIFKHAFQEPLTLVERVPSSSYSHKSLSWPETLYIFPFSVLLSRISRREYRVKKYWVWHRKVILVSSQSFHSNSLRNAFRTARNSRKRLFK